MPRRSQDVLQAQITGPLSPAKRPVANVVHGQRRQGEKRVAAVPDKTTAT